MFITERKIMGSPSKTLQETLTPVRWLNWIFGHGIFEIGRHPRPLFSVVYAGTIIIGYLFFINWYMLELIKNWSSYRRLSFVSTLIINGIATLLSIIFSWTNEKCFKNLVVKCEEINKTLKPFGMGEDYEEMSRTIKHSLIIWFAFVMMLYGTSILYTLNDLNIVPAILLSISMVLPIVMNTVVQLSFLQMVWCIDRKLCKINSSMSEISESENLNRLDMKQRKQLFVKITIATTYNTRKNFNRHLLGTLKQVHLEIIRISRTVNEIFCGQNLLDSIQQLVLIIGGLYNMYFEVRASSANKVATDIIIVTLCFWVFLSVAKLVFINNTCQMPINKTKIMKLIIGELDCLFTDKNIKEQIQQFSLQLALHPLCFNASKFICINNRFTSTFCGTVATYLVILIQMTSTHVA